jgi:ABC-2 type transport system permease protein
MRSFLALVRKDLASLFAAPTAYLALTVMALVTALLFFDNLRQYNLMLFLVTSNTTGGFDVGTIPETLNLWDRVFSPVMDSLGLTLVGAIPLITMRVFAEERARGTDELLITTSLTPTRIVLAKFTVTFLFVTLMMMVSFIYPMAAIEQGGVGMEHLAAVFLGLLLLAFGVASVGLACSAFTSSQLVAAVAGWAVAFVLWDFSWANAFVNEGVARFLEQIALFPRFGSFAEGMVRLDNLAYFGALALIGMATARFSFDLKRVGG